MLDFDGIRRNLTDLLSIGARTDVTGRTYQIISGTDEVDLLVDVAAKSKDLRLMVPITRTKEIMGLFPEWRVIALSKAYPYGDAREHLAVALKGGSLDLLPHFCRLVEDIGSRIAKEPSEDRRRGLLIECLAGWHQFFREERHRGLTDEQQRGLFAELLVLRDDVLSRIGPDEALAAWRGPDHASQDFVRGNLAIEVKATSVLRQNIIKISSAHQLDTKILAKLWLNAYVLDPNDEAAEGLLSMVDSVRDLFRPSPNALALYERKLQMVGLFEEHRPRYEASAFAVSEQYLFQVRPGFPRLLPDNAAISNVRYEIDLRHCTEFKAPSPEAALKEFCQ